MSSKKVCPITQFLEKHDREFHQSLYVLGQLNLFKVRGSGITFLYPADEKFRRKIIHTSYSDNPDKAVDMIKSLVLLDYLPTVKEFDDRKDDIPNSLKKSVGSCCGGIQIYHFKKATTKLKPNPGLNHSKLGNQFVFGDCLVMVNYQLTGTQSTMKYHQNRPRGSLNNSQRLKKISFIEKEYATGRADDLYKQYLTSLYKKVLDEYPQYIPDVYSGICALPRATFYTLFAPYDSVNNYLPNELFLENVSHKSYTHNDYIETRNTLVRKARGDNSDVIFDEAQKNCQKQKKILSKVSNPMEIRSQLKKSYKSKYGEAGDKFLAKDLFTVYCGLSILEENLDSNYFQRCFMYVVKNVYDNQLNIVNQKGFGFSI